MPISEIMRRLRQLEGRRMASCLDVPIFAYGLKIDAEDRALAATYDWPACIHRPTTEASAAMVSFLTKHLVSVGCEDPRPGDCLAFDIKAKHGQPDHVGVLSHQGLVHLVLRRSVTLVPHGPSFEWMMKRTKMVLRQP